MKVKYIALGVISSFITLSSFAAPDISKKSECLLLENDQIVSTIPCSVEMTFNKQSKDTLIKIGKTKYNISARHNGKNYINSIFSIDNMPAGYYLFDKSNDRRVSYSDLESIKGDVYTCYETLQKSICHK